MRNAHAKRHKGISAGCAPEFQAPHAGASHGTQGELETEAEQPASSAAAAGKQPWPKALPDQVQALRSAIAATRVPQEVEALASRFKGARRERVAEVLEALVALGQLRREGTAYGE